MTILMMPRQLRQKMLSSKIMERRGLVKRMSSRKLTQIKSRKYLNQLMKIKKGMIKTKNNKIRRKKVVVRNQIRVV
jgi:hypothetical protein